MTLVGNIRLKIGDDNLSVFKTPGMLNIDAVKAHCDPKWLGNSEEQDLQFCISNLMSFFVKNSEWQ